MSLVTSFCEVTIKEEPHCEEHDETAVRGQESQVKREPESDCSDGQVKQEPDDWPNVTVKLEDLYSLYPDHEVKEEMIIGSEVLQQSVATAPQTCEENARAQQEPLHRHQKCNHSGQSLSCKSCRKTNNTTHSQGSSNTCDKKISSTNSLLLDTGKGQFPCDVYEKKFTHNLLRKKQLRIHSVEKTFTCEICNKKFAYRSELKRHHLCVHSGVKPFTCDICNKKFTYRSDLIRHLRTHSGEKPFSCEVCNKKFAQRSSLTSHLRVHIGEKLYTCDVCNKKFIERANLICHLRVHSREKPFACDVCNNKFTRRSALTTHLRIHSGEKPFSCDVCNRKFTDSSNVIHHLRTHTGEKPFACDICNKKFKHRSSLTTHLHTHSRRPRRADVCKEPW